MHRPLQRAWWGGVAVAVALFPSACVHVLGLERLPPTPRDAGDVWDAVADRGDVGVTRCVDGSPGLQTDRDNCGRCGHGCLGGGCEGGRCKPVLLTGGGEIRSLALDSDYVYFASMSAGAVARVPKAGGPSTPLGKADLAWGIDVGPTHIVWTSATRSDKGGGVYRCPKDGCGASPERVVPAELPGDVVLLGDRSGATFAYAEQGAAGASLWNGTAAVTLFTDRGQPFRIAADETYLYLKSFANSLDRIPLAGGPSTEVGDAFGSSPAGGVSTRAGRVYWSGGDKTGKAGFVRSAATANVADSINYANAAVLPYCVAVDDANVYWGSQGEEGSQNGGIYTCPLAGCTQPTQLAQGLDQVLDIEVDERAIYFGLRAGGVFQLAKP